MSYHLLAVLSMTLAVGRLALGQDHSSDGTRQLYYLATTPNDTLPPLTGAPTSAAPKAGALHLGLRYNVVLIDRKGKAEQISSDRVLKERDCFAIDLESNRAGYLYVLDRQSSGSWMPLLPSSQLPGQKNQLEAGKRIRIPNDSCFDIHNPPGAETLFVVLSRDPRDFYELFESVKAKESQPRQAKPETQLASAEKVNKAVEHLDEKFGGSRDISVTRIPEPTRQDEPKGAVYVVNTSDKLSSSLVTKIEVRHD
jgi:hypothetical protein